MVQCLRGPTPSACSVHSTPRWHQLSTKASLLSRGSLPRYHAEHKPPALRSRRPPTASPAGEQPVCAPAGTAPADCCAAGCACTARCAPSRPVSMASCSRCHLPWRGLPGAHVQRSSFRNGLRCVVALLPQ